MDNTNYLAIMATVAASFSALSSFIIMLTHRRNLYEANRPELVCGRFCPGEMKAQGNYEAMLIPSIKNIGKGTAYDIHYLTRHGDYIKYRISAAPKNDLFNHVLVSGEQIEDSGSLMVEWNMIRKNNDNDYVYKRILFPFEIHYRSKTNWCYKTTYYIFFDKESEDVLGRYYEPSLSVKRRRCWMVNIGNKLATLPLLNKIMKIW